ncbi:MAG: MBL fold metallo-hydrolase [Thermoplasmata archaeon]|nr:MAG: MBL fold metallo-hydrolase [Thermoplasmata archaeon]
MKRVVAVAFALLLTGAAFFEISHNVMAHNGESIMVTFISNEQFIIEDGTGIVIYTDVIQDPAATDPDPDIILITHDHADHFVPVLVEQMATTYGAVVVGPNPVIDALEGSVPPEQLIRMDPPLYGRMIQTIQGIEIRAYHGSGDNNSYRFDVGDGAVIYHGGDNGQSDFEQYISNGYTELYNLNIAMLADFGFDFDAFNSTYNPDAMIGMHFMDHCEVYENYPEYITLYTEEGWQYSYLPDIDVKFGGTPIIDGAISPGEWDGADFIRFYNDQGEINVYYKHDGSALYFMSQIVDSTYYFGDDIVIGIDTEHNGGTDPQVDDFQFYILRDVSSSQINRGTGTGWNSVPDEEWAGEVNNATSSDASGWIMEISISYAFLNITAARDVMGIEFRSYDDDPQGWFNWPSDGSEMSPDSWADLTSSDNWNLRESKVLYVGGTGPENYTLIQDAINDAVDGDTVYVFDDSAPYYEHVVVNRSINLTGEDRDTTIIDGGGSGDVVTVVSNWVNMSGFTVRNSGSAFVDAGILVVSNSNNISGNTISDS